MSVPKPPAGEPWPYMIWPNAYAFNEIDVELTVGTHGNMHFSQELGPLVLGVSDIEYDSLAQKVDTLKPERGDAFTTEGYDPTLYVGRPEWQTYSEVVDTLCACVRQSTYMRPSMYPGEWIELAPKDADPAAPSMKISTSIVPNLLEDARRLRIVPPFWYAQARAVLRDIPAAYVDAYSDFKFRDKKRILNGYRRNMEMVRTLHDAANEIVDRRKKQPSDEHARLIYAAGAAHAEPLSYILDRNGVKHEVTRFGLPYKPGVHVRVANRLAHHGLLLRERHPEFKAWKANAEAFREERW